MHGPDNIWPTGAPTLSEKTKLTGTTDDVLAIGSSKAVIIQALREAEKAGFKLSGAYRVEEAIAAPSEQENKRTIINSLTLSLNETYENESKENFVSLYNRVITSIQREMLDIADINKSYIVLYQKNIAENTELKAKIAELKTHPTLGKLRPHTSWLMEDSPEDSDALKAEFLVTANEYSDAKITENYALNQAYKLISSYDSSSKEQFLNLISASMEEIEIRMTGMINTNKVLLKLNSENRKISTQLTPKLAFLNAEILAQTAANELIKEETSKTSFAPPSKSKQSKKNKRSKTEEAADEAFIKADGSPINTPETLKLLEGQSQIARLIIKDAETTKHETRAVKLETAKNTALTRVGELEIQANTLRTEIIELQNAISQRETAFSIERKMAQQQIDELTLSNSTLRNTVDTLTMEKRELEVALTAASKEPALARADALKAQVSAQYSKITILQNTINQCETALSKEREKAQLQINILTVSNSTLGKTVDTLTMEKRELQAMLTTVSREKTEIAATSSARILELETALSNTPWQQLIELQKANLIMQNAVFQTVKATEERASKAEMDNIAAQQHIADLTESLRVAMLETTRKTETDLLELKVNVAGARGDLFSLQEGVGRIQRSGGATHMPLLDSHAQRREPSTSVYTPTDS
ncbi:MAG: hypothetical protein Q7V63_07220 [Gammaproteobacteria bacterium]|nr:hypothetical protein [Gammaproteobacteria bacterium]